MSSNTPAPPDASHVTELYTIPTFRAGVDWQTVADREQCAYLDGRCLKTRKSAPKVTIGIWAGRWDGGGRVIAEGTPEQDKNRHGVETPVYVYETRLRGLRTKAMNSCTRVFVHFVWATWDREAMITPGVQEELYACIADRCRALKGQPLEIGGIADHVHVLARVPATVTLMQMVHDMKGASSHLMNHVLRPGGNFRWQGAYGAFSVSL